MPDYAYTPGLAMVHIENGKGSDDGTVSWHMEGHWSLNQSGWQAITSQVNNYFVTRTVNLPTGGGVTRFQINDYNGSYAVDTADQTNQAASIWAIVTNTGYLNGGW